MLREILEKMDKFLWRGLAFCMILLLVFMIIFAIAAGIDYPSRKLIGTEKVKCIDEHNRPFDDEWCGERNIYCSWLGVYGERCEK